MNTQDVERWHNDAWPSMAHPRISIAVPFYACDVIPLAHELLTQAAPHRETVELLFADDGSPQPHWRERLQDRLRNEPIASCMLQASRNLGRSAIRNHLIAAARGEYLLFIDADMLPDAPDYLDRYLKLAEGSELIYGGRSYARATRIEPAQRLYHYFSQRTECRPAYVRQQAPARYVMTNNLLVRRELLQRQPFAEAYRGWGYEDNDWAMGLPVSAILHADNSASHLGLIDERSLLAKLDESRDNFLRIAERRPAFRQVPAYRAAVLASRLPTRWLAAGCRTLALTRALPLALRSAAVQGYRLAIYADALRTARRQ